MIPFDERLPPSQQAQVEQWRQGIRAVFAGFVSASAVSTSEFGSDSISRSENGLGMRIAPSFPVSEASSTQSCPPSAQNRRPLATIEAFWDLETQRSLILPSLRGLANCTKEEQKQKQAEAQDEIQPPNVEFSTVGRLPVGDREMVMRAHARSHWVDRGELGTALDADRSAPSDKCRQGAGGAEVKILSATKGSGPAEETGQLKWILWETLISGNNKLTRLSTRDLRGGERVKGLNKTWKLTGKGRRMFPRCEVPHEGETPQLQPKSDAGGNWWNA